jgi:hypothetical protein
MGYGSAQSNSRTVPKCTLFNFRTASDKHVTVLIGWRLAKLQLRMMKNNKWRSGLPAHVRRTLQQTSKGMYHVILRSLCNGLDASLYGVRRIKSR